MAIQYTKINTDCPTYACSSDKFGCPAGVAPNFIIRRHDIKPSLKIEVQECDLPMDLKTLVVEVNMWALAKIKKAITSSDTYFRLADDIGFEQIMVGDVIVFDRVRSPEHMLVTGFDETNKLVSVQRGYHGTTPSAWKKGQQIRIFRILNGMARTELNYEDVTEVDGSVTPNVLQSSFLVYDWNPGDTCLPGCYWLEFKVLKMIDMVWFLPGGHWTGDTHTDDNGYFRTGTLTDDASVVLSYDQVTDTFLIPSIRWTGDLHLHTDDQYYTGSTHTDGSVLLDNRNSALDSTVALDDVGLTAQSISVVPSFTSISLTAASFGCHLGDGVEWVRRFPAVGEGYLVKIVFSPTSEL